MGSLLSSAIKMQGSTAAATATLNLYSELIGTIPSRSRWYKNGVLVGTFTGSSVATLNAGDTFYITANDAISGLSWYIAKNSGYQEGGSDYSFVSATYTALAGDVFDVIIYIGF
jgi:hypothetical protein